MTTNVTYTVLTMLILGVLGRLALSDAVAVEAALQRLLGGPN